MYTLMPFAASTSAAHFENSSELFLESHAMATPRFIASAPSSFISVAIACVACVTVYTFIAFVPAFIVPLRPAVPN